MDSTEVDWTHGAAHMLERHGVTVAEATEALTDPARLELDPDPASKSGVSIRVIGWSHSRQHLVSVVLVPDLYDPDNPDDNTPTKLWGANGWDSNNTDQRRYNDRSDNEGSTP